MDLQQICRHFSEQQQFYAHIAAEAIVTPTEPQWGGLEALIAALTRPFFTALSLEEIATRMPPKYPADLLTAKLNTLVHLDIVHGGGQQVPRYELSDFGVCLAGVLQDMEEDRNIKEDRAR